MNIIVRDTYETSSTANIHVGHTKNVKFLLIQELCFLSVCLSVYLSIYLSIYLSVCLTVCLSI